MGERQSAAAGDGVGASDHVRIGHKNAHGDSILGTVRASSWGDMFDCGMRWYFKYIEGVRGRSGGAAVVGTSIHKGSAVYDQAVLNQRTPSIDEAVAAAADYARTPTNEDGTPSDVDWGEDEEVTRDAAVDFAVKLTAKYCQVVAPSMKYTAIEVKCTALDVKTDFGVVRMTGTTDRVRDHGPLGLGIGDFKSGKSAVEGIKEGNPRAKTKGHVLQLGAYTLMTEAELQQRLTGPSTIIGFQVNSKLHIAEGTVLDARRPLVGVGSNPGLITFAAAMLKTGVFYPNPKSTLCSEKYCAAWSRCKYHE